MIRSSIAQVYYRVSAVKHGLVFLVPCKKGLVKY